MHVFDRAAWETIREDNTRIAHLHDRLLQSLKTGACQTCGAAFHRDEMPGVMVVTFTCEHDPAPAPEFAPRLTALQRDRLGLPL